MKHPCEIGDRFGKLEIMRTWSQTGSTPKRKQKWCECRCDCGNVIPLRASALRHDSKIDCGCVDRRGNRNLSKVGEKYGKLTIVRRWSEKKGKKRERYCECRCDCGNVVITRGRYLRMGHKKSCGCLQRQCNNNHPCWKGHGEIGGAIWNGIKSSAKRKGRTIEFDITIEQAWELFLKQGRKCALSGVEIKFSKKNPKYEEAKQNTASLDRIDSSKPYILSNVQWVHKDINLMKMGLPQERFLEWCKIIAKASEQRNAPADSVL